MTENQMYRNQMMQEKDRDSGALSGRSGIVKFGVALVILAYIVWLLVYTSGSTRPFEQVAQELEASISDGNLVKQDSQALKRYYGLNSADYEGVLFYSAESSVSAEEVLLIKVRSEDQVQQVRDAVEKRLESRESAFEGYMPEQEKLLEDAQLLVRGNYIFLAVSPDAASYAAAFAGSL